jgi:2-dehydro-3-deoxyphosphogluconate aldolase / (4S)-4-hydroxy-2-oxoglutarate aldolase
MDTSFTLDPVQARASFEAAMATVPVIAIVRLADADSAVRVASAVYAGGIRLIEVTLTTAGALDAVGAMRSAGLDGLSVGVGSVRTPEQAGQSIEVGAEYLVSPTTNPAVIDVARTAHVPVVSGGLTPTELDTAHQAGADYVKLFPASAVSPRYLREVLAPMPDLRIVPTGGVTAENVPEFRAAGAVGVGIGSALVDARVVAAADWPELQQRASALVAAWHG